MTQTINNTLLFATQQLKLISETASLDARVLLAHAIGVSQTYLYTWPDKLVSNEQHQQFQSMLKRRLNSEPIAYILGYKEFWSLPLKVTPATLIPRPETELIVEFCLNKLDLEQPLTLLDLGTGSGAIAIALASMRPHWQITAVDVSRDALMVAQENAEHFSINNVQFICSDWFENISASHFDIIISNPPYISNQDHHLNNPELAYEPHQALVSDHNGIRDLTHIITHAMRYLSKDGYLILEHGYNQSDMVTQAMKENGYNKIINIVDLSGIQRVTAGRNE